MSANLGFRVLDYSTGTLVGAAPRDDLLVVVPKRPTTLPALDEGRASSVRIRDKRLYFETRRNALGDVTIADVPPDTYAAAFLATGYVPARAVVKAPLAEPLEVRLHRDASFRFAGDDTLIVGEVVKAGGGAHTGFDVTFVDLSEAIPRHSVPLNAKGQFVVFVPEKQTTSGVKLLVEHASGILTVVIPAVILNRPNIARQKPTSPVITVP